MNHDFCRRMPTSPLRIAGNLAILRRLLAAGADPTVRNRASETPLAVAIAGGHREAVQVLLEAGSARGVFGEQHAMP